MSKFQRATGMRDLIATEARLHRHVRDLCFSVAQSYNFDEINLPLMENIGVFARGLGETSDVVSKEMFLLHNTQGEPKYALRPEGTAGTVRAIIENGLQQISPLKLFYEGPMFRYERPQKGRYRQFWQAGVEYLGVDRFEADVEVITLGWEIMRKLGVDHTITVEINSLGDPASREAHKAALLEYLSPYKNDLSAVSQERMDKNPLRIFDSKEEQDRAIIKDAPLLANFLSNEAKIWFDNVCNSLSRLNIPFKTNALLVRGLDYYTHTAFEFISADDSMGAQSTVLAGGRYNGLVKQLGGSQFPGVGWAAGVDRLSLICQNIQQNQASAILLPMGDMAEQQALFLAQNLRSEGIVLEQYYGGNLTKRLNKANKTNIRFALILGEDELNNQQIMVRDLQQGTQEMVSLNNLAETLKSMGVATA